jgi:hypothetical protein
MNGTPSGGEVADLMDALRERVAEKKAAGLYSLDGLASRAGSATEPLHVQDLIWLEEVAEIRPDLNLVQSTKPGVGAVVGKAKGKLARATSQPLLDLAVRQSQFNAALLSYLTEVAQEITTLRARVRELEGGSREAS